MSSMRIARVSVANQQFTREVLGCNHRSMRIARRRELHANPLRNSFSVCDQALGICVAMPARSWHSACELKLRAPAHSPTSQPSPHPQRRIEMLIKDLSQDLDVQALSAVRGGNNGNAATNAIGQQLGMATPIGLLNGGPANNNVDVSGSQYSTLYNTQVAGDSFLAFPFWVL
jgi:hypothetical protein